MQRPPLLFVLLALSIGLNLVLFLVAFRDDGRSQDARTIAGTIDASFAADGSPLPGGATNEGGDGERAAGAAGSSSLPHAEIPNPAGLTDELAALRERVADYEARLEEEDVRNTLLRERLERTTAELGPDSTRAVLRDLLALRKKHDEAEEAGADAEAEALQAELMPKMLRFLADRDKALESLFEILGDDGDDSRGFAVELLHWAARIPGMSPETTAGMNQSILDVLAGETDGDLAQELIEALALNDDGAGQAAAEPVLNDLYRHEDEDVREEVVEKLDDIQGSASARESIARIAADPNEAEDVRERAVRSLDPERPGETDALLSLSRDDNPDIREAAYRELRGAEPDLARPRLHDAALNDPDPGAQRDAIRALEDVGDASSLDLLSSIENDPGTDVETRAKAKDAREDLLERLEDEARERAEQQG